MKIKKRIAALGLAAALTLSLAACGEKKPSLDEVEQAIESGTLTLDDALKKGYVDQDWVDAYREERAVPAGDKLQGIGDFTTTTLSGKAFTKSDLNGVLFFAFIDPASEGAADFYQTMADGYEGVKANGADMILCVKGEGGEELLADAPFPVILWNDSLKTALGDIAGMVEDPEVPNTSSWYANGGFLSAWYFNIDADDLAESATTFVQMADEMGGDAPSNNGEAAGMAPVG